MSSISLQDITGTNAYSVPESDAALDTASAGINALLSGIAGLNYNALYCIVPTNDISGDRILSCQLDGVTYNGEKCPDDIESVALMAVLIATLTADADISAIGTVFLNLENMNATALPAHASSHENGGSDEINVAALSGVLADDQTPAAHKDLHIHDGTDEVDGDTLDITYVPSNYQRIISPTQVTSVEELTAHLGAIDNCFTVFNATINSHFDGSSLSYFSAYNIDAASAMSKTSLSSAYAVNANALNMNVLENPSTLPSWLLIQAPNTNQRCALYRVNSGGLTNNIFIARFKFNQKPSYNNDDGDIGLFISPFSGPIPDFNNYIVVYLNKSDGIIYGRMISYAAGVPSVIGSTSDKGLQGQPLEIVAIHKIGNNWYGWIGNRVGSWIYLGSVNRSMLDSYIGFITQNNGAVAPGTNIVGCDYIQHIPNDTTFLI